MSLDHLLQPSPAAAPSQRTPHLFGRQTELSLLGELVSSIPSRGSAVLLIGEPGVGKSRLIAEASAGARAAGCRVLGLGASGSPDGGAGLAGLVSPLLEELPVSTLTGTHRRALETAIGKPSGGGAAPLVVYTALLTLLTSAAGRRPILLAIDDFDLLDGATVAALGFVIRRLGAPRIGLVASASSDAQGAVSVDSHLFAAQHTVTRLAPDDTEALVAHLAPELPSHARARVAGQSEGNPLAVFTLLEEARAAVDRGDTALPALIVAARDSRNPFAATVTTLPVRTRRALLLLALDARSDLRALRDTDLAIDVLTPAEGAGLISLDLKSLSARFSHPLVRSAVVARATARERRLAHLSLAMRSADDVEEKALHLAEAIVGANEMTAGLLERAAGIALARGDSTAAVHALAHSARVSPRREDRHRRSARAAFVGTDSPFALNVVPDVGADRHRATAGESGSLYVAAAEAFAQVEAGGGSDAACRTIRAAVEAGDHGWDATSRELLDALNSWLLLCWIAGLDEHWSAYFGALAHLQPDVPEPLRTVSVAFADPAGSGRADRDLLEQKLAGLDASHESGHVVQLATAAIALDLVAVARPAVLRLIRAARGGPATMTYIRLLGIAALHDFDAGRWQQAEQLVDEGMAAIGPVGAQPQLCIFLYVKSLLAGARGDASDAAKWAGRLDEVSAELDARGLQRFAQHARVLAASAQQRWDDAYLEAIELSAPGTFAPFVPHALWVAFDLVEAAIRTGRMSQARAHHEAMVASDLASVSPRLDLMTRAAGAIVDQSEEWSAAFDSALAVEQASDWPFEHARVLLAYGSRLRLERRWAEARHQLHQALTAFERLGATPWADRAGTELRAARGDIPSSVELTPQERRIAELAASGLSNKEIGQRLFLSARTVSGHLYRVFPKLGISRRSALRDALQVAGGATSTTDAAAG